MHQCDFVVQTRCEKMKDWTTINITIILNGLARFADSGYGAFRLFFISLPRISLVINLLKQEYIYIYIYKNIWWAGGCISCRQFGFAISCFGIVSFSIFILSLAFFSGGSWQEFQSQNCFAFCCSSHWNLNWHRTAKTNYGLRRL